MRYAELERVLNSVDNQTKPPIWIYIRDNYEKIIHARESGVTYKKMAAALGVTPRSFSVAMKKARTEIEKQKAETVQLKKAGMNKTRLSKDDLPPPPGSKVKNNNQSSFVEL